MFTTFNNHQLRRFILAFGSFFDSIYVTREDASNVIQQTLLVPIDYGPKERWLTRLITDPDFLQGVGQVVPRLAFEMTGIAYDGSRHIQSMNQFRFQSSQSGKMARTWAGVPYTLNFELSALVKFQADGFQITEQILPYFTPDLTFTIQTLPGASIVDTVPLTLNSVTHTDNYEGDFEKRRVIIWTYGFSMKVFFYGPTKVQDRIEQVQVDIFTSPYMDLAEPPYVLTDELGAPVFGEDGSVLYDEHTSDAYTNTDPSVQITATADPLDQDNMPPNVTANTIIQEFGTASNN